MQINLAEDAGFCFGVKRAVDLALQAGPAEGPWRTLGPLIHNRTVSEYLALKNIGLTDDINEIADGGVIIRTHGVPPAVWDEITAKELRVIDATCPLVQKVQQLGKRLVDEGYELVVVGDAEHPEVMGIVGWAGSNVRVAQSSHEVQSWPRCAKMAVVCQTTKTRELYAGMVGALAEKANELRAFNTICSASEKRQQSARDTALSSDGMVVIGDHESSNTRSLVKVCQATGTPTIHVESARDLEPAWFTGKNRIGVTAGASTPDWLIKEVINFMSELDTNVASNEENHADADNAQESISAQAAGEASFAQMEAELAESLKEVDRGRILTGIVIQVSNDEVMVDVGGKSEGIIPLRELSLQDVHSAREVVKVGDEIEVMVLRWDDEGTILLSKRRVDREKCMDTLEAANSEDAVIAGTILKEVKGGLLVDVGVVGFLPASQVEDGFVKSLEGYVGQTLDFHIIEFNRNKRRGSQVVLSRRKLIEQEKSEKKKAFWDDVAEGQIRAGVVKRLTTYGAFIDLGGYEGLLHISEIDHSRISKPSDVLSEGQEINVCILGVDHENQRVSLSRKKTLKSPWEEISERYPVDSIIEGKVVRIAPFGAFVELEPGVDGLIHISQLANRRVAKADDVVTVGQNVKIKVLGVDPAERRIALSLKAVAEDGEEYAREYLSEQDSAAVE